MAKLKSTQIGYFAQEATRIYSKIKGRDLIQTEKDLFDNLGFALTLDYDIDRDFARVHESLNKLADIKKETKIRELEEQLMKLKEVAK